VTRAGTATIVRAGPLTTVQDLGRRGHAHLGVPPSGAADPRSLRLANRLVGNPESAACLETTVAGPEVLLSRAVLVAVTGAEATPRLDGRPVAMNAPVAVRPGQRLDVGMARTGVRTYVAVSGGFDVPPVLGSRSTDLLSGIGPAPLRDGDVLPLGDLHDRAPEVDVAPVPPIAEEPVLRLLPGPRDDWFAADALGVLCGAPYEVAAESNRIGLRLKGAALVRAITRELPSEGLVTGAVQVPAGGQPLLFLNDHPTTGGYPVIGVVRAADLPLAAQARPGGRVRFRVVG
jgi:biotin-dependent carboxylase-like uncharacterized protein